MIQFWVQRKSKRIALMRFRCSVFVSFCGVAARGPTALGGCCAALGVLIRCCVRICFRACDRTLSMAIPSKHWPVQFVAAVAAVERSQRLGAKASGRIGLGSRQELFHSELHEKGSGTY